MVIKSQNLKRQGGTLGASNERGPPTLSSSDRQGAAGLAAGSSPRCPPASLVASGEGTPLEPEERAPLCPHMHHGIGRRFAE